ncbi:MAG: T9SS type A sorting domain-containing protein [Flavobacteriales bacterium]|nr:T9SS type A sorting domain-containing protein [Flavobacteriales bacterium]
MKSLSIILALFIIPLIGQSQNLISNGSFEEFDYCPNDWSMLEGATDWDNPSGLEGWDVGTPDFYHGCTNSDFSTPYNHNGYQVPHTGEGYVAVVVYSANVWNAREYVATLLDTPLVAGECYYFEMFVNLADDSDFTTDDFGVYFNDSPISNTGSGTFMPYWPQISQTEGEYFDEENWTKISSYFIAEGGEIQIIIGNFKHDTATTLVEVDGVDDDFIHSYVFIDDVHLSLAAPCEIPIPHDHDSSVSIEENSSKNLIIYPNPVSDRLSIAGNNIQDEINHLTIQDLSGRCVIQSQYESNSYIDVGHLLSGRYILHLHLNSGEVLRLPIIKT